MAEPGQSFYKFKGAPSGNVPFPQNASMTAAELLTFLPNHLTSADVVFRFASNHGTYKPMVAILDAHRTIVTPNLQNLADYCQRNARRAMREFGHKDWTLHKHRERFAEVLRHWDPADLRVESVRTRFQIIGEGKNVAEVPFVDLAGGVKKLPEGDDALDLTRLVHYCLQRPGEQWMYPTDYAELLQVLGSEQQVTAENLDSAIFNRWKGVITTYAQHRSENRESTEEPTEQPAEQAEMQSTVAGTKRARQESPQTPGSSSTIEGESPERRQSTRQVMPSQKAQESMEGYLTDDSLDNNEQSQVKRRRINNGDDLPASPTGSAAPEQAPEHSPDFRGPLRWMKPPTTTGPVSLPALHHVFDQERTQDYDSDDIDSNQPWAPYAFPYGPRIQAPFRQLHLIQTERLTCADLTGWAENLRWAREQFLTFGETSWTECPEHMNLIAEIRMSQVWASGELMISIQDQMQAEEEEEALMTAMMNESQASMQYREPILGRDNGMGVMRDEYGNPMGPLW